MSFESARDRKAPLTLSTDVVVVGSGAGGATVATELAQSGWRVVVLEEGARVDATDHGRMRHIAMFGGMIHDEGGGVVMRGPGREPFVRYRMAKRDRARIPRIVRRLGETFLAAGAREVYPPVLGLEAGLDADAFRRFDFEGLAARRFECSSQHPLGTARIGGDARQSVCDADGRVWGVDGLHVADGSVLPTSLGVNPQESIMAVATRIAWRMRG